MEKINILIAIYEPDMSNHINQLVNSLKKKGNFEISIITVSNIIEKKLTHPVINLRNIKIFHNKMSFDDIKKLLKEKRYNIDDFMFREINLLKQKRNIVESKFEKYVNICNNLIKNNNINFIFNINEGIVNKAAFISSIILDIPFIYTDGSSLIEGMHISSKNMWNNRWIQKKYIYDNENEIITFVDKFRNRVIEKKPFIGWKENNTIIKYVSLLIKWLKEIRNDDYIRLSTLFNNQLVRLFNKFFFNIKYNEINDNDKYFIFPLHAADDAQITLRAVEFYDEAEVIKKCAEQLPDGYYIYVKEHPNWLNRYKKSWIKKIKKIKNVKLINYNENIHDLLKNAVGVITINSDVGWEAILHNKPVAVLADPFYNIDNVVFRIKTYSDLEVIYRQMINNQIDINFRKKVIYAALKSHRESNVMTIKNHGIEFLTDNKQIESFTDSLIKDIDEFNKERI